jgi:hypothetical protein
MIEQRWSVLWSFLVLSSSVALAPFGCTEELGPERLPVARVKGWVTERGRPVTGGWLEFFPVDGGIGNIRAARLRGDGSFDADRVGVGLNLIRLVNTDIQHADAARLFGSYQSPIRRTISAQGSEPLYIELVDEATLWDRSVRHRARAEPPRPGRPP